MELLQFGQARKAKEDAENKLASVRPFQNTLSSSFPPPLHPFNPNPRRKTMGLGNGSPLAKQEFWCPLALFLRPHADWFHFSQWIREK